LNSAFANSHKTLDPETYAPWHGPVIEECHVINRTDKPDTAGDIAGHKGLPLKSRHSVTATPHNPRVTLVTPT